MHGNVTKQPFQLNPLIKAFSFGVSNDRKNKAMRIWGASWFKRRRELTILIFCMIPISSEKNYRNVSSESPRLKAHVSIRMPSGKVIGKTFRSQLDPTRAREEYDSQMSTEMIDGQMYAVIPMDLDTNNERGEYIMESLDMTEIYNDSFSESDIVPNDPGLSKSYRLLERGIRKAVVIESPRPYVPVPSSDRPQP